MSDLIDRYVLAVAANLPKKDRSDVPAELRDILYSKVEAKEAQLGRPLNKTEEEALLRAYGHPLVVAASYGKHQQLIGPAVYPFYIFTLKIVGGILIAITIVELAVYAVTGLRGPSPQPDVVAVLFSAGGLITLIFALIERSGKTEKLATKWRVRHLPRLGAPSGRSPFEILFEIAALVAVILWWVGVLHVPKPAPPFIDIAVGPVFHQLHWVILAYFILQVAIDVFELVSPGHGRTNAWLRIGYHVLGLGLLAMIWQAGHWIDVSFVGRPDLTARLGERFDQGFEIGLTVTIFIILYEIGRAALRLVRYQRLFRTQTT